MLAKQNGNITIIAIGIGNETDVDELRDIATKDQASGQSLIYQVGDFEALKTLNKVVATVACGCKLFKRCCSYWLLSIVVISA